MSRLGAGALLAMALMGPGLAEAGAQDSQAVAQVGDSVRVQLSDTDFRFAVQALGRYLSKPVLTENLGERRIEFFETPRAVPVAQLPDILRGLAESQGLTFVEDSTFYRITDGPPAGAAVASTPPEPVAPQAPADPIELFTVRLKHARAADVAATLNQLYGFGGGFRGRSGLSGGTLSDELRGGGPVRSPGQGGPSGAGQADDGTPLDQPVTIVPDELTNSLLVRATRADFEVLMEGVAELDVRPLQVLIEVIAVEARKDRQFSLGFDVSVPSQDAGGVSIGGSLTSAGLGDLVVEVMTLGKAEVNAILTAARSRGEVEILSRPVLLASNNTEARLLVGTQQPFVQVSRSLPTDTPQRDQVIQYRDVGTKLTVLPTINQDGYVSLLIQQEISQATGETQFSAPVISSRETLTQVLVRDAQTIVIGGLRDRVQDQIRTGIPVLSDIPILGGLFGGTKTRTTETELFLFITPTIIDSDEAAEDATLEHLHTKFEGELPEVLVVPPELDTPPDTASGPGGGR